ncbi:MAG: hypothetical protein HY234_05620 [Acidobacteria bacterium]|nr:hypothetical protein [Acidobacteriota bacterium]MBI3662514.1 hypothetical protein [Acidobacteriota bacterium]
MKRNWLVAAIIMLALLAGPAARAADDQAAQSYTPQEYSAFNAAVNEKDAALRARQLEDFISKYPKSTLLPYVYRSAAFTYMELKNYPSTMQAADKLLALGESVDTLQDLELARIVMYTTRATAFFLAFNQRQITTKEQLEQGRDAAAAGIKFLDAWKKPEKLTDEQFAQEVKRLRILFNTDGGIAALQLKDYKAAVDFFRASLVVNAADPVNSYRLGLAYLQQDPPQSMDGFWAVARSIALKMQGEAQIRNYLKNQLNRYQQPTCDALLDAQLNELITLAGGSADRPAGYSIPSRPDLDKVMQEATVDVILRDLKGGGDRAKIVWLAVCDAEFPELGGKVFETAEADGVVILKVFTAGNPEEIRAGTAPNMEVRVEGQPQAVRLKKDDEIVYSAALKSYTPDPFMIQLGKAKVQAEYLPPEEKTPAKAPAKKAPPKKAPAKRPPPKSAGR